MFVDFDITHWTRALFCVPLKRSRGIATLWDGTTISEKKLDSTYLSLKERIEFRKRVFALTRNLFSFPKWDIDGPDIQFFAQSSRVSSKDIFVGPWILDGRKLVADAKDMALMLAEAVKHAGGNKVQIINPFPKDFQTQRGWNVGAGIFFCFWSGVRKAAECSDIKFYAVSEANPFPFFDCPVEWGPLLDDVPVACPSDAFACMGTSKDEERFFNIDVFQNISKMSIEHVKRATLCVKHRNPFWNPKDILHLLRYKTK